MAGAPGQGGGGSWTAIQPWLESAKLIESLVNQPAVNGQRSRTAVVCQVAPPSTEVRTVAGSDGSSATHAVGSSSETMSVPGSSRTALAVQCAPPSTGR